jgi:hypothetical protein
MDQCSCFKNNVVSECYSKESQILDMTKRFLLLTFSVYVLLPPFLECFSMLTYTRRIYSMLLMWESMLSISFILGS